MICEVTIKKGYLYHFREWRLKNAPDHCCCKLKYKTLIKEIFPKCMGGRKNGFRYCKAHP